MKTIVAPIDFSSISLNALNYAADMACVISTDLSVLHMLPVPPAANDITPSGYNMQQMQDDAEVKMELVKEDLRFRTGGRIHIQTEVMMGEVVLEIERYCSSHSVYAVVMGAESKEGVAGVLSGRRTIAAVKQLSWPVIVVPAEVKFTSLRKIGLACDFRNVVETIPIREISSLMNKFKAELHVLHVSSGGEVLSDEETMEEAAWLRDILAELHPEYHFIRGDEVEKNIENFAAKNELDLLVIIPKKHSVLYDLFRESHSKKLVLQSQVPVMAIHE